MMLSFNFDQINDTEIPYLELDSDYIPKVDDIIDISNHLIDNDLGGLLPPKVIVYDVIYRIIDIPDNPKINAIINCRHPGD